MARTVDGRRQQEGGGRSALKRTGMGPPLGASGNNQRWRAKRQSNARGDKGNEPQREGGGGETANEAKACCSAMRPLKRCTTNKNRADERRSNRQAKRCRKLGKGRMMKRIASSSNGADKLLFDARASYQNETKATGCM